MVLNSEYYNNHTHSRTIIRFSMFTRLLRTSTASARFTSKSILAEGRCGIRFQSTAPVVSATPAAAEKSRPVKTIDPNILELRVGLIKEIKRHENADSLFVSQIQIGPEEASIAQVCSGLVGLVPMEALDGRRVIVVNNLKPSKMRGVKSEAMLLCADGGVPEGSAPDCKPLVEPVTPPVDAAVGSVLSFVKSGAESAETGEKKRIKTKAFQEVSEDLAVDDKMRVVWRQEWVLCDKGDVSCVCTVKDPILAGAQVR